jgi:predicted metal-dependent peptidase
MSEILENTIIRLLKARPFYGHLALSCRRQLHGTSHPMGLTLLGGVPTILVDPEQLAAFTPSQQEALLEHVLKHLLHLHPLRRKDRHRGDWDLACDLAINQTIDGLPPDAVQPERFRCPPLLAAEEYYARLVDPYNMGGMAGSGIGTANQDTGVATGSGAAREHAAPIDDHQSWDKADSTPLALAEEMVRGQVLDAVRRSDGLIPADIRPLVATLLAPPLIPWRQILRQFVATAGRLGRHATWLREHRRFQHGTPGMRKRHRLNLLVGVDVSESTDTQELREAFAKELLQIARARESRITVLYANSRVQRIQTLQGSSVTIEIYRGGGFTDLRPVFHHARTVHPRPAAVIYLTDGYGPAPEAMEFPTLWVLPAGGAPPAPWGVPLYLQPEQ